MFTFVYIKIKFREWPLSVVICHYDSKQNQPVTFKSIGECYHFHEASRDNKDDNHNGDNT